MLHQIPQADTAVPPVATAWTVDDVERWLIAGFREMLFRPVYAPGGNMLLSVNTPLSPSAPSATFDIVAFAPTVLGKKSKECLAVLTWARSLAARDTAQGDWSIAEFCREKNWPRRTFDRRRLRACQKIALAKNIADGLAVAEKKRMPRRPTT